MRSIDIKAIATAMLAVLGIDFLSVTVLARTFGDFPANATDAQLQAAIEALHADQGYLTGAMILGTASTIVGGYLTARLSRSLPYYNALTFGLLSLVLGLMMTSNATAPLPAWFRVLGLALTLPAALAGAWVFKQRSTPKPGS